jgi:hypothetical protein
MSNLYQAEMIRARFLDMNAPHIDSKYIIITPLRKRNKTWIYEVSTKNGATLGFIKWYPQWREYCFFPDMTADELVFSRGCKRDIADFEDKLMVEHSEFALKPCTKGEDTK